MNKRSQLSSTYKKLHSFQLKRYYICSTAKKAQSSRKKIKFFEKTFYSTETETRNDWFYLTYHFIVSAVSQFHDMIIIVWIWKKSSDQRHNNEVRRDSQLQLDKRTRKASKRENWNVNELIRWISMQRSFILFFLHR